MLRFIFRFKKKKKKQVIDETASVLKLFSLYKSVLDFHCKQRGMNMQKVVGELRNNFRLDPYNS